MELQDIASQENFFKMYEFYYSKMYNYVFFRVQNRESSEDLVSEIFLKLFENRIKFDARKAKISTWIFTVARNCLSDYFRKDRKNRDYMITSADISEIADDIADNATPEDYFFRNIEITDMIGSLQKLDAREFDIVYLKYVMSLSYREISSYMNITEKNASVILTRTLKKLKKIFEET